MDMTYSSHTVVSLGSIEGSLFSSGLALAYGTYRYYAMHTTPSLLYYNLLSVFFLIRSVNIKI